ncbi:agmatine deiminase family protein [Campylobacter sp. VBCF_06 NA8]|uniref:agmatine deiminase family protein n=1 Tax=Campylobacter sp. VBCF_06 NA8 TaxID=2983822 RepID=UPI0022E9CC77|nr:agmatine deiminase family protein [Campylobacter sp. VBCF_06 NA8]MDA3046419.1 agmatine deiminase family protein [Campylobacter sp. VBCF_06 NA8]
MRAFAEWENQNALLVSLPHEDSDWAPYLGEISSAYTHFIRAVAQFQPLIAIAPKRAVFDKVCGEIDEKFAVNFVQIPTNDTWIRDYGAIDVENEGKVEALNFTFNAWGGKFASEKDNALNATLYEIWGKALRDVDLILEGGSVEFNGAGVLITTEECLLNDNRNALSKEILEQKLGEIFGLKKIIWLKGGFIQGDDTDCHIDTLARFVGENLVAVASCDDSSDIHYPALRSLKEQILAHGFEVIELPLPAPIFYENRRLGATYANFVFVNGGLIVPTYGDKNDEIALSRLSKACPGRKVVGVDARVFIRQNGSLHCSCMNKFSNKI